MAASPSPSSIFATTAFTLSSFDTMFAAYDAAKPAGYPGTLARLATSRPAYFVIGTWSPAATTLSPGRARSAGDPMAAGLPAGTHAYFVHSYHLVPQVKADLVASTDYGGPITAFVAKDNMAGTQFHPEKSQKLGLALIANFLRWKP